MNSSVLLLIRQICCASAESGTNLTVWAVTVVITSNIRNTAVLSEGVSGDAGETNGVLELVTSFAPDDTGSRLISGICTGHFRLLRGDDCIQGNRRTGG